MKNSSKEISQILNELSKIMIALCLLLFICMAGGCSAKSTDSKNIEASTMSTEIETEQSSLEKTAEYYIDLAKSYREQGDMIKASQILEEGYAATHDAAIFEILTELDASVKSGEYQDVFNVEIISLSPVYYTLDGEDPTSQSSLYTNPIPIPEGETVLKIVSITADGTIGDISIKRYVVESIEAKNLRLLQTYFFENFDEYDDAVFLYDVTNDGINEMVVVSGLDEYVGKTASIFTVKEGKVVLIHQEDGLKFRNMLSICIYEEKVCLLEIHEGIWQGSGEQSYNLFNLTSEGEKISLITDQISGDPVGQDVYDAFQIEIGEYEAQEIVGLSLSAKDAFGLADDAQKEELYESTYTVQSYEGILYINYGSQEYYIDHPDYRNLINYAKLLPLSDVFEFIIKDNYIYFIKMIDITTSGSAHMFEYGLSPIYRSNLDGSNIIEVTSINSYEFYIIGDRLYCSENDWIDLKTMKAHKSKRPNNISTILGKDGNYVVYHKLNEDGTYRSDSDFDNECKILEGGTGCFWNFVSEEHLYALNNDVEGSEYLTCYTINGELTSEIQLAANLTEAYQYSYLSDYLVKDNVMFCEFTVGKSIDGSEEVSESLIMVSIDLSTGTALSQIEFNPPVTDAPESMYYHKIAYADDKNIFYESYLDCDSTQPLENYFIVPRNGEEVKIFQMN